MQKKCFLFGVILLGITLFLPSPQLKAQTYYFETYGVKDGLAQSKVYDIIQGGDGYIWLGTKGGISRFNGISFKNFSTEDGLAPNGVRVILKDSYGNLWLGNTDGGVTKYDGKTFRVALQFDQDVTSIIEDYKGNIWVTTHGAGAFLITNANASAKDSINYRYFKGQEGLSDRVFSAYETTDHQLLFITDAGLKKYSYEKNTFDFFELKGLPSYFQITSVYEDSLKNLWFGTYNGGLYEYDQKSGNVKIFDIRDGLASNFISTFTQDRKGNVWVGTWGGGINVISKGQIKTFNKENGLPDLKIRKIIEDREGNILIGTNDHGLLIYRGEQFVSYTKENGLPNERVLSVVKDWSGNMWFGGDAGISVVAPDGSLKKVFNQQNKLIHNEVSELEIDKNGDIWIGFYEDQLLKYNHQSGQFEYPALVVNNMGRYPVTAIKVDKFNNLWVGTIEGLIYYEINNKAVSRLTQSDGLNGNDISALYADDNGVIWVGSRGKGLTSIDGVTFKKYDLGGKYTPTAMVKDKDGRLWVGTEGQGIFIYGKDSVEKKLKVGDGLLSNLISTLNIDSDGNIWIGTNQGLNKWSAKHQRLNAYTEESGFTGIEVIQSFKEGNNIWYGTVKGAIRNNLLEARTNELETQLHITKLLVNQEPVVIKKGLDFNYRKKSFYIEFEGICLSNPKAVQYQFMLEGADENWRAVTSTNHVSYSPLPPNNYTFKLRARNNEGVWTATPVTFSFKISPPFYQRWWFYTICLTVVSASVVIIVRWREAQLKKDKKLLEQKVEERTEEVVQKSKELEEKNNDIMDSIHYAKRIQTAILPPNEMIDKELPETFVLFKPKDVVSGDFYWLFTKDNKTWFAAVDCTGHGVPGAFVSIVGHNLLDKIVGEYGIHEPSQILDRLNQEVAQTFRQKDQPQEGTVKDGMDMALICLDKENFTLSYAGAYNPLILVRKGEVYETKGDRFPIGSFTKKGLNDFTNQQIKIERGDAIYMFSDGYPDQFGGPLGKKFKTKNFKELLASIQDKNMKEQKKMLDERIESWMKEGGVEQVDDILVIGMRL